MRLRVRPVFAWAGALGLLGAAKLALIVTDPGSAPTTTGPALPAAPASAWAGSLPEPEAGPETFLRDPSREPTIATDEADDGDAEEAWPAPVPRPPMLLDPAQLEPSELAILQQLALRRATLEQRERELELRAALLETAEAKIAERLAKLSELKALIEATIGQHDAREEEKLASLVKIYETMNPKAAAEIFNRLEMPVLLEMVERMRETKSSAVLARMDPAKAKQVTVELARRRQLSQLDLLRAPR